MGCVSSGCTVQSPIATSSAAMVHVLGVLHGVPWQRDQSPERHGRRLPLSRISGTVGCRELALYPRMVTYNVEMSTNL